MFPYRTLLILGAGASRPYLFPTANELSNLILERNESAELLESMGFTSDTFNDGKQHFTASPHNKFLRYRQWLKECLRSFHFDADDLQLFQKRFDASQAPSVDAFVADNQEFQHFASVLIATILLKCEQEQRLGGNLYQLIFNELIDEHGMNFPSDTLSVVTFNYDRSLEMYLFRAFLNRYNLNAAQAWELVKRMEIVHVYGSFGSLFNDNGTRQFGYGAHGEAVLHAAKNLRLIGPRTDSEHLINIRALIDRSPRIIFLGFGFDRLNLSQIQMPFSSNRRVFASCFKLSAPAMARAQTGLGLTDPQRIEWGEKNDTALDFLNNSLALV